MRRLERYMRLPTVILFTVLLLGTVTAACTDSDEGKNKYSVGTVNAADASYTDECDDENIKEYFCSMDQVASYTILPCVNGCAEGQCLLANKQPRAQAPAISDESNMKIYMYAAVLLILIGLYVYLFKIRNKK